MVKSNKTKLIVWIVIAILITLLLSYYFFSYRPQQKRMNDLNEYKKALYDSSLCQYKCPLANQIVNNKTQLLPNATCIHNCVLDFQPNFANEASFSTDDLEKDNLFQDILGIVSLCKKDNSINGTIIDSRLYFSCVSMKMESLPENYTYLK